MRCLSWNVNGIRALEKKAILAWEAVPGCDVVCLQETKAHPGQLPEGIASPAGWHAFWSSARKKGYSGVAVLTREPPDELIEGFGEARFDEEGRMLAVRFGRLVVASAYFPNSQPGGKRLDYKLGFCAAVERFLSAQRKKRRQVLLLGDFNIAHQPIDLARPESNESNPGYLPEERAWFDRFCELGYRDRFRDLHPGEPGHYTWWSYRTRARERNVGWRLDYAAATPGLADRVVEVVHHADVLGSDHCPLSAVIER
ncbi:MAG: exodeoxyribonuclease III [Deltaproteobacteria bacterium]|nr:exodeoxyribonuclease III [Deltaproteobacteria bacterium]